MVNTRVYTAVNERTKGWYDPLQLIDSINSMARLCDPETYSLEPASEGQAFFRTIGTDDIIGIEAIGNIVDPGLCVAISSVGNHPKITKARLEAHAKNLELKEV